MASIWQKRLSQGEIVPYFQPIVSVETQKIAGYESLGRQVIGSAVHSLGEFFQANDEDPDNFDFRRNLDRELRLAGLRYFAGHSSSDLRFFINVTPRLMLEHLTYRSNQLPWTLKLIAELGIDPRRVVIELTEQSIGAETATLKRLVAVYREFGCSIAIDDVGAEASNLDRIGYFEPDIIKIDAAMIRRSIQDRSFRQVLAGLRTIGEGLGAALLFEGVETEAEIQLALRYGARYFQGWYFAPAAPEFVPSDTFNALLLSQLEIFGETLGKQISRKDQRTGLVVAGLSAGLPTVEQSEGLAWIELAQLKSWEDLACRVFITDRRGFQISPNYVLGEDGWMLDLAALGRCRTARPYFADHGIPNRGGAHIWSVSEPYFDLHDRKLLRTYGRFVSSDILIFVDVLESESE